MIRRLTRPRFTTAEVVVVVVSVGMLVAQWLANHA